MAIANIVLQGFGNGTVEGSIASIVTRGYDLGEPVELTTDASRHVVMGRGERLVSVRVGSRLMIVKG